MPSSNYTLHSGGAAGADVQWAKLGKESGLLLEVRHWTTQDLLHLPTDLPHQIDQAVNLAAQVLGRPFKFQGINLVKRNWFQAYHCQALYAISTIIPVGGLDKGFRNTSGKEVVAGGTGWTVEMAIQMGKRVYVFDQAQGKWFFWEYLDGKFVPHEELAQKGFTDTPILTQSFAGIGSRNLLPCGVKAIKEVYTKTLAQHETVNP
ncbi:hypothetical protein Q5H92_14505 [Hymenobacter sp. M29]|uniref:Uncharacterized protein n=1 Tax=Hymenobacter mellowenesis TaxID=3063995 RepID=A0ABT9ADF3_9BACT|nr:hypothetical protein [Hymenobacter sp. M29]MDO7847578.1 hypothetical protein [Hymenobacter sp. M29]